MDERGKFKYGFLLKCAEAGLSPAETDALVKRAGILDTMMKVPRFVGGLGALGLLGAAGVGATGGLALASATDHTAADPSEIKKQELTAAYNTFRQQMEQRDAMKRPRRNEVRIHV